MRELKISQSITNRESISLNKYFREIDKLQLISPEEEVLLARRIRQGDQQALDQLTKANLRFVVSVAKQYQGQGLSLPDLINEGNVGLIMAANRFDETRGFKFISFAVWHIRQNILYALALHARMIRLPLNKVALGKRIQQTHSTMEQRLERAPSAEEIAENMNMDIDEVMMGLKYKEQPLSLDTPFSDEDDGSLIDVMENTNADKAEGDLYHRESLKKEIARSLKQLSEIQHKILCYFFGIGQDYPLCLDEIAQKFDLTPERVRQIKETAISKLRKMQNFDSLKGFLGA